MKYYNIKPIEKSFKNAEYVVAAKIAHSLTHPPSSLNNSCDNQATIYQRHINSINASLKKNGIYSINLGPTAMSKLGSKCKSGEQAVGEITIIPPAEGGGYHLKMHTPASWSGKQKLAALKAFVMEARTLGLKTFSGIMESGLSFKEQVEFIKEIRSVYGQEANIPEEKFICNSVKGGGKLLDKSFQSQLHQQYLASKTHHKYPKGKIGSGDPRPDFGKPLALDKLPELEDANSNKLTGKGIKNPNRLAGYPVKNNNKSNLIIGGAQPPKPSGPGSGI